MKKIIFTDFNEMMDYYEENSTEIHSYTLEQLMKFWKKYKKIDTVDIFDVKIKDMHSLKYMCVLEKDWGNVLNEMEIWFLKEELFEKLCILRDFKKELVGFI